jgi:hypothetical protein
MVRQDDDPVAARFEARALTARALDRGLESRLGHVCLSFGSLCLVVLCTYRPCDELITGPRSPTVWLKID